MYGWKHGSNKEFCPTFVFRVALSPGMALTRLAPVRLRPPSRDEAYVASKRQFGGVRPRVDGYMIPVRPYCLP